jgi:hypothetical protein
MIGIISFTIIIMIATVVLSAAAGDIIHTQLSFACLLCDGSVRVVKAPIAVSGDNNVYVVWWTNKTGENNEVMFRASNDGGATFAKKINLSNTTTAESEDAQIAASGKNVYVTWWERNQTANVPVMKISTDNGKSFGPILNLASNGTLSNSK